MCSGILCSVKKKQNSTRLFYVLKMSEQRLGVETQGSKLKDPKFKKSRICAKKIVARRQAQTKNQLILHF